MSESKPWFALTHAGELWKAGGHDTRITETPLLFLHRLQLSALYLVIMVLLHHRCLFGAAENRKKRWACSEGHAGLYMKLLQHGLMPFRQRMINDGYTVQTHVTCGVKIYW